jgi:hypothetical protein
LLVPVSPNREASPVLMYVNGRMGFAVSPLTRTRLSTRTKLVGPVRRGWRSRTVSPVPTPRSEAAFGDSRISPGTGARPCNGFGAQRAWAKSRSPTTTSTSFRFARERVAASVMPGSADAIPDAAEMRAISGPLVA